MRYFALLLLFLGLLQMGCTVVDYHTPEPDPMAPVHDGSNGRG
jgi:hypothetical protein